MDNELNVHVVTDFYQILLLWLDVYGNLLAVSQTSNVHLVLRATISFANLFVTATETAFRTSFASRMCVKKFVERMGIVVLMKFVKVYTA